MLKLRFTDAFARPAAGWLLVMVLVLTPWLWPGRNQGQPAGQNTSAVASSATPPSAGTATSPCDATRPLASDAGWIPPLSEQVRYVLAASFSDVPPLEPWPASPVDSLAPIATPELLSPRGEAVYPLAGAAQRESLDSVPPAAVEDKPQDETAVVDSTPWPQPETPAENPCVPRSESLERVAQEADRHTRHGFELAGRGAYFAARSEFIVALRIIAQGLDSERANGKHSRALADALTAIAEAEEFIPTGAKLEADLDLGAIIATHRTPELKAADTRVLTSMLALRRYLTFAQEKLAEAVDHEVAGSVALHALGKLHVVLAGSKGIEVVAAEPKAVAFFQAAIVVFPNNAMAANDLGVLLARAGHFADARAALERSVAVCPQPAAWHNLGLVYRRMNRADLAQWAEAQAAAARQLATVRGATTGPEVQWVDPQTFARATGGSPAVSDPPTPAMSATTAAPPVPRDKPVEVAERAAPRPSLAPALPFMTRRPASADAVPLSTPWPGPARR